MRTVFRTTELPDQAVERYHAIEGGQQTRATWLPTSPRSLVGSGGLMAGTVFFELVDVAGRFIAPPVLRADVGVAGGLAGLVARALDALLTMGLLLAWPRGSLSLM
jgi:hypothetical protein